MNLNNGLTSEIYHLRSQIRKYSVQEGGANYSSSSVTTAAKVIIEDSLEQNPKDTGVPVTAYKPGKEDLKDDKSRSPRLSEPHTFSDDFSCKETL